MILSTLRASHPRRLLLFLAAAAGLCLAFFSSSRAWAAAPVPEGEFWAMVHETISRLAEIETLPAEGQNEALIALTARWEAVESVVLSDQRVVPLETGPLLVLLKERPANLRRVENLLKQLLDSRESWPSSPFGEPDAAAIRQVLARSEYQWDKAQEQNLLEQWLEKIRKAIEDFFNRLIPDSWKRSQGPLVINLRPLFTVTAFLVIALLLFFGFRGVFSEMVKEAALSEPEGEAHLSASSALEQATRFSQSGDNRLAVRYLYLSALLLLEERGLLRYDRSLTNREYLRVLAGKPELAGLLREVIDVFDRVWYGFQPIDQDTYEHYAAQVTALKEQK